MVRTRGSLIWLVIAIVIAFKVPASADPITILNNNFDNPSAYGTFPTDWTSLGGTDGSYNPYEDNGGDNQYYLGANHATDPANAGLGYDGIDNMLAFVYGSPIGSGLEQTLDATLQADTTYTLSIDAFVRNGTRPDNGSWLGSEIELLAGDVVIASAIDTSAGPTPGQYELQVATVDSAALDQKLVGDQLTVRFETTKSDGSEGASDWDNINLNANSDPTTPEPATLLLVGAGLLGIARRRGK